jgi:hypothetical protein
MIGFMENLVKKELLSARVPSDVKKAFWETVPSWSNNETVMEKAAELWNSLTEDIRHVLLTGKKPVSLTTVLEKIVDDRIAAGIQAGKDLAERQKQKRGQGD